MHDHDKSPNSLVMTTETLSPAQAHALLNILSHHETYAEIQDLRFVGALATSGPPWKYSGEQNELPLLQTLFNRCLVTLPGLRDVSADFWQSKCQEIVDDLARGGLSESYEAGYVGIRKTLSTAAASLIEAPARGYFGGFAKKDLNRPDGLYDKTKPEDVLAAWEDFLQGLVYGELIEELFEQSGKSDKLEDHSSLIQGAHEFILVVLASFIHYILFMSPEGLALLSMLKLANNLVPYTAIKQTLRVGNVATMISGIMKIMLAKISLNTLTTFVGLTSASDSGMNLLQTIISTMINWDTNELKSKSASIVKNADAPSKAQREILDKYVSLSFEERLKCTVMSETKSEPVVVTVMGEYDGEELSEKQIPLALDYVSLEISIRDRQTTCSILCTRQPDLLTQAVREGVAAYDPVIRALHNAVDLSAGLGDLDHFLQDLFKLCLSSSAKQNPPTVEDFVVLLRKHQASCHRFVHQVCKNGPELRDWYKEYCKTVAAEFRVVDSEKAEKDASGAGRLTQPLEEAFSRLSESQAEQVRAECNAHAEYLSHLSVTSQSRLASAISKDEGTQPKAPRKTKSFQLFGSSQNTTPDYVKISEPGAGMFLKRWQAYINETAITPRELNGPVRYGDDPSVVNAGRVKTDGKLEKMHMEAARSKEAKAPTSSKTIEYMAGTFRDILRAASKDS